MYRFAVIEIHATFAELRTMFLLQQLRENYDFVSVNSMNEGAKSTYTRVMLILVHDSRHVPG